jgi:hypothetical protein
MLLKRVDTDVTQNETHNEEETEKSETGVGEDVRLSDLLLTSFANVMQISESHEAVQPAPETAEEYDESATSITNTSPTDEDASSSTTSSILPTPAVSSPPSPFDNPILAKIHDVVSDSTLTKHTSQIDLTDPINEGLYLDLLQELLAVCENVELIVLPQRWKDKWRWAGSQIVELRARSEEEEEPEYEEDSL